ncbi:MAG: hypothetical protein AAF846_27915 [Chloroflexota bacterium]
MDVPSIFAMVYEKENIVYLYAIMLLLLIFVSPVLAQPQPTECPAFFDDSQLDLVSTPHYSIPRNEWVYTAREDDAFSVYAVAHVPGAIPERILGPITLDEPDASFTYERVEDTFVYTVTDDNGIPQWVSYTLGDNTGPHTLTNLSEEEYKSLYKPWGPYNGSHWIVDDHLIYVTSEADSLPTESPIVRNAVETKEGRQFYYTLDPDGIETTRYDTFIVPLDGSEPPQPLFTVEANNLISPIVVSDYFLFTADPDEDGISDLFQHGMSRQATPVQLSQIASQDMFISGAWSIRKGWAIFNVVKMGDPLYQSYYANVNGEGEMITFTDFVPEGVEEDMVQMSPWDGWVTYETPGNEEEPPAIYSLSLSGGDPILLSGTLMPDNFERIITGGDRVFFKASYGNRTQELYSVPITGGLPVKLNPSVMDNTVPRNDSGGVFQYTLSPDETMVVMYMFTTSGKRIYSIPADLSSEAVLLFETQVVGFVMDHSVNVSRDGEFVFFNHQYRQEDNNEIDESYAVPIDGSASPILLRNRSDGRIFIIPRRFERDGQGFIASRDYRDNGTIEWLIFPQEGC